MARIRRTKEEIEAGLTLEEVIKKRNPPAPKPAPAKTKSKEKIVKKKKIVKKSEPKPEPAIEPIIEQAPPLLSEAATVRMIRQIAKQHDIKPKEFRKQIEGMIENSLIEFLDILKSGVEYRLIDYRKISAAEMVHEMNAEGWIFCSKIMDGHSLAYNYLLMRIRK
jgi:hypothetical protein